MLNFSKYLSKTLFFATFCLCIASPAHAQRVARILYYGAPKSAPETSFVYTKKGGSYGLSNPQEVILERHNFSASFDLAAGPIRLGFLPQELPEDGAFPVAAPGVNIPESWSKVLILVSEDAGNPIMPIRLQAINASKGVFGPGELLFVNYSRTTIFGLVGEKKLLLKPQTTKIISDPVKEAGSYRVSLDSVKDGADSRQWLLRQPWRHEPDVRRVVFILPLPAPRVAKIYTAPIRDF